MRCSPLKAFVSGRLEPSPPKSIPGIYQERLMVPLKRIRQTPRSLGSVSVEELLISSSVGKGESGKEVGICVIFATTLYVAEIGCREEFHPAFIAWFRFTDLACVMKALVVGLDI